MTELLTGAQMRSIEAAAIASGGVTGLELMGRAGAGVVAAVLEEWPEFAQPPGALPRTPGYLDQDERGGDAARHRAVVLCGPGNNGGDGFVVARLLAERGWAVEVLLYGDAERLPPDARVNYERWLEVGEAGPLAIWQGRRGGWQCDLVVDALFGTGLSRALPDLATTFWNMDDMVDCFPMEPGHDIGRPAIVAVDLPSGLCADSGRMLGSADYGRDAATAHLTVSFHRAKVGHFLGNGPECCGKLAVVDIGLKSPDAGAVRLVSSTGPVEKKGAHKYSHGHALIVSGDHGRAGAARLSARGALRVGAGVVTLASPPDAMAENAARVDAIMLREVAGAADLAAVLGDARINALCLGPAMGVGAREAGLVAAALQGGARATVLDADALTLISRDAELFGALHEMCVLTPHGGEFARLFPDIAAKLAAPAVTGPAYSKVDATREAAARAGCVVLYKGADTVIAAPDGRCAINSAQYERAAPWLATAGSGDVLAGIITGLLARGFQPFEAACTGAWLHVECALEFGPGLIAEDLPEMLPKVFRRMGI